MPKYLAKIIDFCGKMIKMYNNLKLYFTDKKYVVHLYKLLGFDSKQYIAIKIISHSKTKYANNWYYNNVIFALIIILIPNGLTWIHDHYDTVSYNKSFIEILISGSLTLIGVNVLRSTTTMLSEKLDETKVNQEDKGNWEQVKAEIISIRNKLQIRANLLTFLGGILYIVQIGQFINANKDDVYWVLLLILVTFVLSIVFGRIVYLMNVNFLDNEAVAQLLLRKVINQGNDYQNLEDQLKRQGL